MPLPAKKTLVRGDDEETIYTNEGRCAENTRTTISYPDENGPYHSANVYVNGTNDKKLVTNQRGSNVKFTVPGGRWLIAERIENGGDGHITLLTERDPEPPTEIES